MEYINDNYASNTKASKLYQVLIAVCQNVPQPYGGYSWLYGYCLLTCRIGMTTIQLSGEVDIGDRYEENAEMIASLAEALDPSASLVGIDLTNLVSELGQLPIDADEPEPALALLSKLQSMLESRDPVDLSITGEGRKLLHAERLLAEFACPADQINRAADLKNLNRIDSRNPALLAEYLADEAGACLLGFGQLRLTQAQQTALHAQWQTLRRNVIPPIPTMEVLA